MIPDSPRQELALTAEQRAVVELPWNSRALVIAGAGAGKTTTLTYRLESLTSTAGEGDDPLEAAEILVLSFSRAAVRSLRDRIEAIADSARRVRAYTFDAWARSILHTCAPERDLTGMAFDEVVLAATEAIRDGIFDEDAGGPVVEPPSHIVIDEVQDLVGVRRTLVEAVLEATRDHAGFTVVGDAAQSVYGFQIKDLDERAAETNRFFGWLRSEFASDLVEKRLSENFRARSEEARVALRFGPPLQSLPPGRAAADAAAQSIYGELRETLRRLQSFGALVGKQREEFTLDSLRDSSESTAILCATNAHVLRLSESFCGDGVPHSIQRSPRSRPAPRWLVQLFQVADGSPTLSEARFRDVVAVEPQKTWTTLRTIAAGRASGTVDLSRLHRVLVEQRVPDELVESDRLGVLLSTVHRAKGLEFDRVLVLEPFDQDRGEAQDFPSQARLLYVAMTRARYDNYRLDSFRAHMLHGEKREGMPRFDRWYKLDRYGKLAGSLEFRDEDVAKRSPAHTPMVSAASMQEHLACSVHRGDLVRLVREPESLDAEGVPIYGIWHGEFRIGEVSERFRRDLSRSRTGYRGWQSPRWPDAIEQVQIDCVETVGGSTAETARVGLGTHGVWLAPRLCGLGRFVWHKAVDDDREAGE